jgi:hypothetical protein
VKNFAPGMTKKSSQSYLVEATVDLLWIALCSFPGHFIVLAALQPLQRKRLGGMVQVVIAMYCTFNTHSARVLKFVDSKVLSAEVPNGLALCISRSCDQRKAHSERESAFSAS